MTARRRKL